MEIEIVEKQPEESEVEQDQKLWEEWELHETGF
jgi:hypothetical protein